MPDAPIQHKPKHLEEGAVFDARHPAASAFAPLQPAAGVVADDADEKGQNLAGGTTASAAAETYANQGEELAKQHEASLRAGSSSASAATVEGDTAKPAENAEGEGETSTASTSRRRR